MKAHELDDGRRIRGTQEKGTTSRTVESLVTWTCWEADNLKKENFIISKFHWLHIGFDIMKRLKIYVVIARMLL